MIGLCYLLSRKRDLLSETPNTVFFLLRCIQQCCLGQRQYVLFIQEMFFVVKLFNI